MTSETTSYKPLSLTDVFKTYIESHSVKIYGLVLFIVSGVLLFANTSGRLEQVNVTVSSLFICVSLGWLIYLLEEYFTHVWIFHMPSPKNTLGYRLLYRLHMGHHDDPKRMDILITPFWFTLPVLFANLTLFYLFAPNTYEALGLALGLLIGYLEFEWFHLLVHTSYPIENKWVKFIQKRHLAHHYRTEKKWFTVTPLGSLLDDIFSTGGSIDSSTPSKNSRNGDLSEDDERLKSARVYFKYSAEKSSI